VDNPNDSKDDCMADVEPDMEHDKGIDDSECPEQQDAIATPNVPGMISPP
jgi:hypothetical protein